MISADRHTSARSTACLLQTMTVHPCSKSSRATGLPTILDLPITTARLPLRSDHALKKDHAAHRRAGPEASRTRRAQTDMDGMTAITVIPRVYGSAPLRAVDLLWKRELTTY